MAHVPEEFPGFSIPSQAPCSTKHPKLTQPCLTRLKTSLFKTGTSSKVTASEAPLAPFNSTAHGLWAPRSVPAYSFLSPHTFLPTFQFDIVNLPEIVHFSYCFPWPNTSFLVPSEQEERKAPICAWAKASALWTEGSVCPPSLGRNNNLSHFRGGDWISRGEKKREEEKQAVTTKKSQARPGVFAVSQSTGWNKTLRRQRDQDMTESQTAVDSLQVWSSHRQ